MVVGRFQVMALLQAARAEVLGLRSESALSWGLNRAIFYAAAKRGFKGRVTIMGGEKEARGGKEEELQREGEIFRLGNEIAFKGKSKDGKLLFSIGGETQSAKDFDRQIKSRFTEQSFKEAWQESLDIVKRYDRAILESGREFFDEVYKPRRDVLAKKWSEETEKE